MKFKNISNSVIFVSTKPDIWDRTKWLRLCVCVCVCACVCACVCVYYIKRLKDKFIYTFKAIVKLEQQFNNTKAACDN